MVGIDKEQVRERIDPRVIFAEAVTLPQNSKTEVVVKCCFHEDKTPSLSLNLDTGMWNCFGGCGGGDIFQFVQKLHGCKFSEALKMLADKAGLFSGQPLPPRPKPVQAQLPKTQAPPIDDALVNRLQEHLFGHKALLTYLETSRGLTQETIAAHHIGYDPQRRRYTIPLYDSEGVCHNIRCYDPNGQGADKMISWEKGRGTARLYPSNVVTEDDVVLCEGEWDCLLLRQNGFAAYTATNGCKAFTPAMAEAFAKKRVTVCYDIDEAGDTGAQSAAMMLYANKAEVKIAKLTITEPENGDVTDWFVTHAKTADELREVFAQAEAYTNGLKATGPKEFRDLIPPLSFFQFYQQMGTDITDAPPVFHLAAAMTAIATVVGNKVWFRAFGAEVYLNLWNVLIAPSGFYRKTTAQNLSLNLIDRAAPNAVLPNQFTPEVLLETLSEQPAGLIPIRELGAFLKQLDREYNSGLKETLTEIYDANKFKRKLRKSEFEINRPAVGIFGASTIEWVVERCKADDLRSGFFARFLFWPGREKNGWKGLGEGGSNQWDGTLDYLMELYSELEGEVVISKEIRQRYNEWLKQHESEVDSQKLPSELQGFYTRISMYVLKFAVLYQIGIDGTLTVTETAIDYAVRLAEYLKSHLVQLVKDEFITGKDGKELKILKDLIRRSPGIDRSTLLRQSHLASRRFEELISTLRQSGEVICTVEATATKRKQLFTMGEVD